MPTDVFSTYSSLQAELNQAKGGLHKLDENLKKIVQTSGRYKQDRLANKQNSPNVFPNTKRFNEDNNNSFNNNNNAFNNNSFNNNRKRPHETKTVFSRLSRKVGDSDGEEETNEQNLRTRISSQVTRTLPTKQEVLRAQLNSDPGVKKDNAEVCRARRVFGSLLGTLRAFCKEEALARDKEVFARRVSLEQRIECKASVEAAELVNQRRNLIQEREQQIQKIKALEFQMHRVQSHEVWEKSQKQLSGFIKTSAKSPIYWSPARHTDKTKHLLASSQHQLRKTIDKRRRELEADLEAISSKRLMKDKPTENDESVQSEKINEYTEKFTEKVTEKVNEKVTDKIASKISDKIFEKVDKATNKVIDKATNKVTEKATNKTTDTTTDTITDTITDKTPEKIVEDKSGSEAAEEEEPMKMSVETSEEEVKADEVEVDTKEENQDDYPVEETEPTEPAEQKDEEKQEPE